MMPVIPLTVPMYVLIWKISSFLIWPMPRPPGVTVMSHHSTAFEVERPVPAGDAVKDLLPGTHAPAVIRKFNFRKALMAGAAVAVLAGAAWYGWDYWTVGQY